MKMKKICLLVLILTLLVIVIFPVVSRATATLNPDDYEPDKITESDVQGLQAYGGRIAGFIRVIGTIVSVGALMIIGIRFMLGSAEEKAEYKERIYPYIIGAVLLFAASNFVDIIYELSKGQEKGTGSAVHESVDKGIQSIQGQQKQ